MEEKDERCFRWQVTAAGIGDSGSSISAISRRSLEPAAEGRLADTRKADDLRAVPRHLWQDFLPANR